MGSGWFGSRDIQCLAKQCMFLLKFVIYEVEC